MENFHLSDRPPVAEAIEAALACHTLDELYAAIAAYRGHELAARQPYTPSYPTSVENPLMIISEKPEAEDRETGRPFSGDYGRVMQEALDVAGAEISRMHVTYAVHWTPEGEKPLNATLISASRPFLFREIEIVKPRAILIQGRAVLEAMSMYRGHITPILGQTMLWRRSGLALQLYISWHPAFALRFKSNIPEFQQQIAGFFERFGF